MFVLAMCISLLIVYAIFLLLTWIVPVAFITTVPVEMLTKQVSPIMLVGGAGIALGLLLLASAFFRMSLRHYTGASS